ncbi:MAG: efflux RND transporter periplasmic adaptor subunit [Sphingomonadales bacterium]|nr:efflux RND transporter periplasmic adaptor subunit [Sphingomonadales bacterium]MDE2172096.1 efflux RND transporter periplasmic adaptor subunit [Sphingomonadales bacterium]
MTRFSGLAPLAALIALTGCTGGEAEKVPEPVALVSLAMANTGDISESVVLNGAVEAGAGSEHTLAATSEATVASIAAPAGTQVSQGGLVIQLVPSPQSALDRVKARSDAVAASNAYARALRLKADGLVGNAEIDAARATSLAANATAASLNNRAHALTLLAPVAGVVDAVLVKPGDLVAAGTPVARIAVGGATRARFGIEPALARSIGKGSTIAVSAGMEGSMATVPVSGVDHVVDPATRLAAVFANLPASLGLAIGEPLRGELMRHSGAHGTVIPYAAVQDDGGLPFVYVVSGGVAHKHEVTLGAQGSGKVLVLSGVTPGEQVVVEGGTAVEDGMKVRTGPMKATQDDKKFDDEKGAK